MKYKYMFHMYKQYMQPRLAVISFIYFFYLFVIMRRCVLQCVLTTFTLSVFRIGNRIFFTDVSLEMFCSHSSLLLSLEYFLYVSATGVKPHQ